MTRKQQLMATQEVYSVGCIYVVPIWLYSSIHSFYCCNILFTQWGSSIVLDDIIFFPPGGAEICIYSVTFPSRNAGWAASFTVSQMEKKERNSVVTTGVSCSTEDRVREPFPDWPILSCPSPSFPLFHSRVSSLTSSFLFSHTPISPHSVAELLLGPAVFQTFFHTLLDHEVPFFSILSFSMHLSSKDKVDLSTWLDSAGMACSFPAIFAHILHI